jgi:hypothetical protein
MQLKGKFSVGTRAGRQGSTSVGPLSPFFDSHLSACREPANDLAASASLEIGRGASEEVLAYSSRQTNHSLYAANAAHVHVPEGALIPQQISIAFQAHPASLVK